jgi:hypothetical protein
MQYILGYVLTVVMTTAAWVGVLHAHHSGFEGGRARATAQQARVILAAVQNYLAANPTGMPASSTASPAYVGLPALVGGSGQLFSGYAAPTCDATYGCDNPFGQQWLVEVRCDYTSCPASASVSGSGPWTAFLLSTGGKAIPDTLLPHVAAGVGAAGGNTPMEDSPAGTTSAQAVQGVGAAWTYPLAKLYNPGPGHLACKVQAGPTPSGSGQAPGSSSSSGSHGRGHGSGGRHGHSGAGRGRKARGAA